MSVSVLAPPMPGHVFYGSVSVDGNQAPAGTVVTAKVGSLEVKSTTTPLDDDYDYLLIVSDQYIGDTVRFYVNGVDTGQTATVLMGGDDLIDLSVTTDGGTGGSSGGGSSGGSSGGGSDGEVPVTTTTLGSDICREKWTCTEWSFCINGKQTRTCTEENGCGTDLYRPFEEQPCVAEEGNQMGGLDLGATGRFLTSPVGIGAIVAVIAAAAGLLYWKRKGAKKK